MEPNDGRYSADLTSPAKTAVDENHIMAGQIHVLTIVVQNQKSRELTAAYRIRALEESLARERSDNQHHRDYIDDLTARLKYTTCPREHAPARREGIRSASQTNIYNLEAGEFVSNPPFSKIYPNFRRDR